MAAENPNCTVYVGNLDERVSDRVLYDILIQAGRVVDLYIPRDKETEKPKGFAFAQYETEEVADYAVKLFSGLVTLYKRTLKFAISGQDKPSMNLPTVSSSHKPRPHPVAYNETGSRFHEVINIIQVSRSPSKLFTSACHSWCVCKPAKWLKSVWGSIG
ncbi:uncharacterized protein [Coffea arabica]|uniref:Uncharacterized protein isoform X1 n=1 Tax=Coffea arabica TaxID=13443 RepID=A0ABM4W178_COFAR